MYKVLIATTSFSKISVRHKKELSRLNIEIILNPHNRKLRKKELIEILNDEKLIAVIAGTETYDKEVLNLSYLKFISRLGSGISNIDFATSKKLRIKLTSKPKLTATPVAELALGALILLLRNLDHSNENLKNYNWIRSDGCSLENKKVLIIGFGRVGRKLASLLKSFNVRILVFDPLVKKLNTHYQKVTLKKGIKTADIISIHVNTESQILGKNEFKIMKKNMILLNSSRGAVVSENDLIKALKSGVVSRVWLDVFKNEPYYGKLIKHDQAFLTPHIGSYTSESRKKMENECLEEIINFVKKIKV